MSFISRLLTPKDTGVPEQDAQILAFGPAILRLSATGKDAPTELDALAAAVAKLKHPQGYSTERVFAAATELARMIRIGGAQAVTDRMRAELTPGQRADAMRLALTAVQGSALRDAGDIAVLAGTAQRIGIAQAEFDALVEAARAPA